MILLDGRIRAQTSLEPQNNIKIRPGTVFGACSDLRGTHLARPSAGATSSARHGLASWASKLGQKADPSVSVYIAGGPILTRGEPVYTGGLMVSGGWIESVEVCMCLLEFFCVEDDRVCFAQTLGEEYIHRYKDHLSMGAP